MSALGQKRTCAPQNAMSALPPIATAKADSRSSSCPLYPRKRTCAVQLGMSAMGQKRTSKTAFSLVLQSGDQPVNIAEDVQVAHLRPIECENRHADPPHVAATRFNTKDFLLVIAVKAHFSADPVAFFDHREN